MYATEKKEGFHCITSATHKKALIITGTAVTDSEFIALFTLNSHQIST